MCWFGVPTFNIVRCPSLIRFLLLTLPKYFFSKFFRLYPTQWNIPWSGMEACAAREPIVGTDESSKLCANIDIGLYFRLCLNLNRMRCEARILFGWLFVFVINSGSSHRKRSEETGVNNRGCCFYRNILRMYHIRQSSRCELYDNATDHSEFYYSHYLTLVTVPIAWNSNVFHMQCAQALSHTHTTRMIGKWDILSAER